MIKNTTYTFLLSMLAMLFLCHLAAKAQHQPEAAHIAPAPLYNDPIYDGAADPVLIWNREEKSWWMLYTTRRANMPTADVSAYYGNRIGTASSSDHGQTWIFRGYLDLEFEKGWNTFWAPDVVYHEGKYHMFVVYIKGVRNHWGGKENIVHYTSSNLWDWTYDHDLSLSSEHVIDASLYKIPNGTWRMWYKDDAKGGITMMSESPDLENWTTAQQPIIEGKEHEGPKVFKFQGYYWMLTDEWHGLRVYRSKDLDHWEKQGLVLDTASKRVDDQPTGAHADVLTFEDMAYIFYFTHPGRKSHLETDPDKSFYENHRTAIQVAPLMFENGTLKAPRDQSFDFWLPDGNND